MNLVELIGKTSTGGVQNPVIAQHIFPIYENLYIAHLDASLVPLDNGGLTYQNMIRKEKKNTITPFARVPRHEPGLLTVVSRHYTTMTQCEGKKREQAQGKRSVATVE